jgi:hypothetical protein
MKSLCISLGHRGPERGLYATHAHNTYNAYKMKMTETIHKTKKPSPTTIPGSARQDLLNVCFCWLWICSPFFSFSAMRANIISHSAICSMGAKSPPFAFFSLADAFMLVWSGHLQRVSRLCSFIHSSPYGKVRAFTPCGGHTPCAHGESAYFATRPFVMNYRVHTACARRRKPPCTQRLRHPPNAGSTRRVRPR